MAGFKIVYRTVKGEFAEAMKEKYKPVAKAATLAMDRTGEVIKVIGRAQIASAGFKRQFQTAWRVDRYPKRKTQYSANAAILAYHRVQFSEVFETGIRIAGKPIMWIPIKDKRTRVGSKQLRLKDFIARGEKLVRVDRPGKPPMLFGRPLSGMKKGRRKSEREAYQRYQEGGMVPLFIGVDTVNIDKKFALYPMMEVEAARIADRYFNALRDE